MFVHYNGKVVNSDIIEWIDYSNLSKHGYIRIYEKTDFVYIVEGPQAFDVVMQLCPEALEGQDTKEQKGRWAIHNFFGHPLMQIFSWLGYTELGLKIHDWTVPNREVDDG